MIKIGISGICGRMGKQILHLAKSSQNIKVLIGLEREDHPDVGKTIEGLLISKDLQVIKDCDCLIEFTNPKATVEHLALLVEFKKSAVIGTTGLTDKEQAKIKEVSASIPIVYAPNMSVGVNLLFKLIERCASLLKDYKVQVEEAHHIHKKDAPSGTAKKIAQIINAEGFGIKTEDIKASRIDEVVGDHRVIFESGMDKIELFHSAKTRDIFAAGALRAAEWVVGKAPGLYCMNDVLDLE